MEKTTHKLQQLLKMHIFAKATISSLFRTTNVGLFISNCHDLCELRKNFLMNGRLLYVSNFGSRNLRCLEQRKLATAGRGSNWPEERIVNSLKEHRSPKS